MTQHNAHVAAFYDNRAEQRRRDREESFDRCDTDGFLSQWAHGLNRSKNERQAEIERRGGRDIFWGLYDGDRRVAARMIEGRYGWSWLLSDDEAERYGRKFIPLGVANGKSGSRVQKRLGLTERQELAPARADLDGSGTGLSGTAWVVSVRTGDRWGQDATLAPEDAA